MSIQDSNLKDKSFVKNLSGWASTLNLQNEYESFAELGKTILKETPEYNSINLWANVIFKSGGYSRPHFHGRSLKRTGVYYPNGIADVPFDAVLSDAFPNNSEGDLILFDPKSTTRNETKTIKHREGLLIFFPMYLNHMVTPMTSDKKRYCIAFSFK